MIDLNTEGLMPRTAHEYREILRVALVDGEPNQELIASWSASRRTVLKAALRRCGVELSIGPPGKGERPDMEIPKAEKQKRHDMRTPNEADVVRIKGEFASMPEGERAGVFLLLQMGLRANEMLTLQRKEVERAVEDGDLAFTRKGGYESILPARHAGPLLEELLGVDAKCGRPWKVAGEVFSCGSEGTQYVRVYRMCRSLGARTGFRGLRPHLLRHAFASGMIRRGAPLSVVQKALGHADSKTTLRYIHADKSDVEKYVEEWDPT
jgi:integrase/recombinase XerD